MTQAFSYLDYVQDRKFLDDYNAYQAKYAGQMRESDKVLIGLVRDIVSRHAAAGRRLQLLDIGCSTGNLLMHLRRLLPELDMSGGDLAESSLQQCRDNPALAGIRFERLDLLDLPPTAGYDIITVNAVLYMLEDTQFEAALRSLARALRPGGTLLAFDFFHPYAQDLHLIEVSNSHPAGLRLRFRPMPRVERQVHDAGFESPAFRPFSLPIDLPPSGEPDDLITYTIPGADGRRMPFRGVLFQPWCHLSATRSGS